MKESQMDMIGRCDDPGERKECYDTARAASELDGGMDDDGLTRLTSGAKKMSLVNLTFAPIGV